MVPTPGVLAAEGQVVDGDSTCELGAVNVQQRGALPGALLFPTGELSSLSFFLLFKK